MPKDITTSEPLSHFKMGLYDNWDDEFRSSIIAERIIDITDVCYETQRLVMQAVLKYGRCQRGAIAQISERYQPGVDQGISQTNIHFFVNEEGVAGLATDDAFLKRASVLGCDSLELAEIICEFNPIDSVHPF